MESELEDVAQITGALNYADVHAIMTAIGKDAGLKKKIGDLVSDWTAACEAENGREMNRIGKAMKDLVPKKSEADENVRLVDLGLDPKFKDMIDAVFGQLSDGYWENTPRMRGYWMFARPIVKDNKICLEIDNGHWKDSGHRTVYNAWDGMTADGVKKFLADKIKFLVKEEGLKWDRGNVDTTDYLSYSDPYTVKDCYYAYELLKGRNVGKHPEYSESADDWDGWENADGLSEVLDQIDELKYELDNCTRGAKTRRKTWDALADYVAALGEALSEAGEGLRDCVDESKKKSPSRKFSSTVEEDEDGRKLSH